MYEELHCGGEIVERYALDYETAAGEMTLRVGETDVGWGYAFDGVPLEDDAKYLAQLGLSYVEAHRWSLWASDEIWRSDLHMGFRAGAHEGLFWCVTKGFEDEETARSAGKAAAEMYKSTVAHRDESLRRVRRDLKFAGYEVVKVGE